MGAVIPSKLAKLLEKMKRAFFWEGKGEGRSDHLVKWEIVSRPKKYGGLGVGNLINKNLALLGKWLWTFPIEQDSLWHSIIVSKFSLHNQMVGMLMLLWKLLNAHHGNLLQKDGIVLWIRPNSLWGKGDRLRFLEDKWVGDGPLKFPRLYCLSQNRNILIQSVLCWPSQSSWVLNFLRNFSDRLIGNVRILFLCWT